MANDTAAVDLSRLSALTLDVLTTKGIPLKAFSTDLTAGVAPKGKTVSTRYADVPAVADFSVPANRTPADRDLTNIDVTLDQYKGVPIGFTDLERSYTDFELINFWIAPAVSSLVEDVISYALGLCVAADFTNEVTLASTAFDSDAVADLAEDFSTRKIPTSPRSIILPPSYMNTLVKDATVTNASDNVEGKAALRDGVAKHLHGFDLIEYNGSIPVCARAMAAIAIHPQALCIAARQVAPPSPNAWAGNVTSVTDPNSGLTIQLREFYDDVQMRYELSVLYGATAGMGAKATIIESA